MDHAQLIEEYKKQHQRVNGYPFANDIKIEKGWVVNWGYSKKRVIELEKAVNRFKNQPSAKERELERKKRRLLEIPTKIVELGQEIENLKRFQIELKEEIKNYDHANKQ